MTLASLALTLIADTCSAPPTYYRTVPNANQRISRTPRCRHARRYTTLGVESLEDRRLLAAIITINSTADTNVRDSELTLREAILVNNRTLSFATLTLAEKAQVIGTSLSTDNDEIRFNLSVSDGGHSYYKNDNIDGSLSLDNVAYTNAADDLTIADIDPDWPHSWFSIAPATQLPSITDPVLVDGYTQGSATPAIAGDDAVMNTNPVGQGLNSVLKIEISGQNAGIVEYGLIGVSGGSGTTLRGLVLNRAVGPRILFETTSPSNRVEGMYVGTDVSGSLSPPVTIPSDLPGRIRLYGVSANAAGQAIGGTDPEKRNLISGNAHSSSIGVYLSGLLAGAPHAVQGNLIGTDRSGTRALGNGGPGVQLLWPRNSVIGGAAPGAANVVSANSEGIMAFGESGSGNVIEGNLVGTDVTGTLDLGNRGHGVTLSGGAARVASNIIAFNDRSGVAIGSLANLVTRNSIFANGTLAIGEDSDKSIKITSVTAGGLGTQIAGTLTKPANTTYRLEFFANPERDDFVNVGTFDLPGTNGEGKTFIGELLVPIPAGGVANFSADFAVNLLTLPGQGGQPFVTATATDLTDSGSGPANATSLFSQIAVLGGPKFVVTSTADTSLGTLREAIINANLTAGPQTITFAIPATDARHFYYQDDGVADSVSLAKIATTTAATDAALPTTGPTSVDPDWPHSWFSIRPSRTLSNIIDTITIDGYSQAGSSKNTLPPLGPLDTVLKIELDGSNSAGDGLILTFGGQVGGNFTDASNSTIQGLAINRFGGDGIELNTLDGRCAIQGSFIGTDSSGSLDLGNKKNGVYLAVESRALIGGLSPDQRLLISGNESHGIAIVNGERNEVVGNVFGTDRTVRFALPAGLSAIDVNNIQEPQILSIGPSIISEFGPVTNVGWNVSGRVPGPVDAIAGPDTPVTIRETANGKVVNVPVEQWAIKQIMEGSRTHALADPKPFLAIDLNADGITPNDLGDTDSGPNGLQNFPMLNAAIEASSTVILGTLNSLADTNFRIEFYSNSVGSLFRAGEQFLGATDVVTNAQGNASFTLISPIGVPAGQFVVSTATRLANLGNNPATALEPVATSEFSDVIAVRDNPWHNKAKPLDVTDDDNVAARDALEIINYINGFGGGDVPPTAEYGVPYFYDPTNDLSVAPNDVLAVINAINAGEGEGEPSSPTPHSALRTPHFSVGRGSPDSAPDLLHLLALDLASQPKRRRA